jgi:hypothetical protein
MEYMDSHRARDARAGSIRLLRSVNAYRRQDGGMRQLRPTTGSSTKDGEDGPSQPPIIMSEAAGKTQLRLRRGGVLIITSKDTVAAVAPAEDPRPP